MFEFIDENGSIMDVEQLESAERVIHEPLKATCPYCHEEAKGALQVRQTWRTSPRVIVLVTHIFC